MKVPMAPCFAYALQVEDFVSNMILVFEQFTKMLFRFLISALPLVQTQATLLEDIQVAPPVLTPAGLTNGSSSGFPSGLSPQDCVVQQVLVDPVFAYSYGQPFVGGMFGNFAMTSTTNRSQAHTILLHATSTG